MSVVAVGLTKREWSFVASSLQLHTRMYCKSTITAKQQDNKRASYAKE